jgi:flavin reductase (DIM6/NTAB) family NADH-FMN oxidoreductase RutF
VTSSVDLSATCVDVPETPGQAVDAVGAISADVYRAVFRRHAAGVVIVTADAGDGPVGFTATSLASVSLDPPLVSFALSTTASSWPTIAAASSVVVNVLDARQHDLAARFATSGIDRFGGPTRWSRLGTGEPVLDDAAGHLRAFVRRRFPVGDHHLVVAEVVHARVRPHAPLVYHAGGYTTVGPVPSG